MVCLFAACKSPSGTTTSSTEIMKTEEAFFVSVLDHSFRFKTLSTRMKLDFSGMQNEFSSRVHLKMIYNDCLQLSVQPILGIEMIRIEMTNDSIKILDRMNKRYMADSYENLKGETKIDFNFQNLQALFTNRMFIPGEDEISTKHYRHFRISKNNNLAELKLKDRNGSFYTFMADGEEKLLSTTIENKNKQTLTWDYSDFQRIDKQRFPMKMTTRLSSGNQTQGTAIFTFSLPEINNPLKMDFNIPSGYTRVTLEQIINSLRKK
jgi:hypothetical protein